MDTIEIIDSFDKLESFINKLIEYKTRNTIVALDTETNGLHLTKSIVIGFSIAFDTYGAYIPILEYRNNEYRDIWSNVTYPSSVLRKEISINPTIKQILEFINDSFELIMHNAVFDCAVIYSNYGIDLKDKLICDTMLLAHFLNENGSRALKSLALNFSNELGYGKNEATKEQTVLSENVKANGGIWTQSNKEIWKGDYKLVGEYGAKDVLLTIKLHKLLMEDLNTKYADKHRELFFETEIMPLAREVVIPMHYKGVYIDLPYFEKLKVEAEKLIDFYVDEVYRTIKKEVEEFETKYPIPKKRLIETIIEKEGLEYPFQIVKGEKKQSLAKGALLKAIERDGHWLWAYLLEEIPELKYSKDVLMELTEGINLKTIGRKYTFNINSQDHMRWLLFDKFKLDPQKFLDSLDYTKKTKKPSLKAEVLEKFVKDYPFIKSILLHKKLLKLLDNYIVPALALHDEGWLRLSMNQAGTTSGRFSCSGGLNLQTLPKIEAPEICNNCNGEDLIINNKGSLIFNIKCSSCGVTWEEVDYSSIKRGFISPKGYKIVNADYNSLEPCCFGFASSDPKLKEVFTKKLDLYSKVYCDMLDPKKKYSADPKDANYLKKVNPSERARIKPLVLGVVYGSGPHKVATLLNLKIQNPKTKKEEADVAQGASYLKLYLDTYPELKKYMEKCEISACVDGYVETLFGRRRRFKHAPIIFKYLAKRNIGIDEFLDAPKAKIKMLKTEIGLLPEDLERIRKEANINAFELDKSKNWEHIRSLFYSELNNAKNVQIQGLAAHITNRAMLEVTRAFKIHNIDGYVALMVHDEITCYVNDKDAERAKKILKECMEQNLFTKQIDIPFTTDPIICTNLKDSK